jgi:hypothetical protein
VITQASPRFTSPTYRIERSREKIHHHFLLSGLKKKIKVSDQKLVFSQTIQRWLVGCAYSFFFLPIDT